MCPKHSLGYNSCKDNVIKDIGFNMVISDRADRSNPGGLMEYAGHAMGWRTSIYNVVTDKGPLAIDTVFKYV